MSEEAKGARAASVVAGIALLVLGIVVLANAFVATAVSVVLLGWCMLVGGIALLVITLFRRTEGFWFTLLGSGMTAILGLVILRHPAAAAVTLTLIAGTTFLAIGIVRLVLAFTESADRVPLVISGGVSTVLGLIVVFNIVTASFTLLGVLLGVQLLSEGVALLVYRAPRARSGRRAGQSTPAAAGNEQT